jgi:hypothetical protein
VLEAYAARGIFHSFSETDAPAGKRRFRFTWLWNAPFTLTFEEKTGALSFDDLAEVEAGSDVDQAVRAFVKEFISTERVEHRRADPKRVAVTCSLRRGKLAIRFRSKDGDFEYAANRAVNCVNELFTSHLAMVAPEFLAKRFRLPED